MAQVEHAHAITGFRGAVGEPGAVQGGHRGAAELGLGDIQAEFGAHVHQAPRAAGQDMVGVVSGVDNSAIGKVVVAALQPGAPRGG